MSRWVNFGSLNRRLVLWVTGRTFRYRIQNVVGRVRTNSHTEQLDWWCHRQTSRVVARLSRILIRADRKLSDAYCWSARVRCRLRGVRTPELREMTAERARALREMGHIAPLGGWGEQSGPGGDRERVYMSREAAQAYDTLLDCAEVQQKFQYDLPHGEDQIRYFLSLRDNSDDPPEL